MFDIEEYKNEQAVSLAAFNQQAPEEGDYAIEYTDPDTGASHQYLATGQAEQSGMSQGYTAEVPAIDTSSGEVVKLPVDFVRILESAPEEQKPKDPRGEGETSEPVKIEKTPQNTTVIEGVELISASALLKKAKPETVKAPELEASAPLKIEDRAAPQIEKIESAKDTSEPVSKEHTQEAENAPEKGQTRRLKQINIKHIMGVEEIEVPLKGAMTVVEGKNGEGKSSILKAVLTGLGGGYPAELIRNGEETGEIVAVLDDNSTVKKRISHKKSSSTTLKDGEGKNISKPQARLNELFDSVAIDPSKFISASSSKQVETMLEASPMTLTTEQIEAIADIIGPDSISQNEHPLKLVDKAIRAINSDRTQNNSDLKMLKSHKQRLEDSLPKEVNTADFDSLQEKLDAMRASQTKLHESAANDIQIIRDEADKAKSDLINESEERTQEAQARILAIQEEISILQQEAKNLEAQVREDKLKAQSLIELTASDMASKISERNAKLQIDRMSLENEISGVERCIANQSNHKNLLENIARYDADLKESEDLKNDLNNKLEAVKTIKNSLLKDIPIDGIEVTEEGITHNGVKFSLLNTAKKAELAMSIAVMRLDQKPDAIRLVVLDGIESMDSQTLHALIDAAHAKNVQIFAAKTTNSEMSINHY